MIRVRTPSLIMMIILTCMPISSAACQNKQRRPNRYLIPENYVGWVRINYKIKNAPAIPVEDDYNLLKFPRDGIINTSSNGEEGYAEDEFYYYSDNKRRKFPNIGDNKLIWGEIGFGSRMAPGQEPTKYEEFFVGTKEEYEKYGIENKDEDLNPNIGPVNKQDKTEEIKSPNDNH